MSHNAYAALALAACVTCGAQAAAPSIERYPSKPIRFVTGGGPDAMARLLGQQFTEAWGQQVVVEQRGGGGGLMSAEVVARANPDGYTLLLATGTHTISPHFFKLPYDMVKDFAPVSLAGTMPFVLSVHPGVPAQTVDGLVQFVKARPGELNYSSGGNGSPGHLIMELFKSRAHVNVVHVPYKSVGQAVTALIGNQVQVMFTVGPSAVPQIKAGRIRGLAVTTAKRSATLPDLPTVAETGYPGFEAPAWNGVLVPSGTPRRLIDQLHAKIVKALARPDVRERVHALGFEVVGSTPEAFGVFIRAELAKWAQVVRESGAKAE